MRRLLLTLILGLLGARLAYAHEFKLQFTPQGGALGLVVAGYEIVNDAVVGNCSYYVSISSGGRGSRPSRVNHYNTCTWDIYGNLISMTPGAPTAPAPLSESGTEIIYAVSGKSRTGEDTRGFGFVSTPSAHYTWETVNGGYADIPYAVYKITATLVSNGDFPLVFDGANVVASISGTITPSPGTAQISSTTCGASVPLGAKCSVTVSYNPKTIVCTGDAYGYAYTRIDLKLITNAGDNPDFTEGFTVIGVPICND
jgi:hypothetical protein